MIVYLMACHYNLKQACMKTTFKSTTDTFGLHSKYPHNCPFCRCSFNSSNHKFASANNIYLNSNEHMLMTFNPLKDEIQSPHHSCRSQSTQKLSITFSYSNPLKLRKHKSADCKFSTKRYKQQRFPHLSAKELTEQPVLQIVKNKDRPTLITSIENTPPKHHLLKINKARSKDKLGIHSKQSNLDSHTESHHIPSEKQLKQPKHTPINYLKYQTPQPSQNPNNYTQTLIKNQPIPLNTRLEPEYLLQKPAPQQSDPKSGKNNKNLTENYPTVKSIELYKADSKKGGKPSEQRMISQQQMEKSKASETSLKIQERACRQKWKREVVLYESDRQLAQNLSEQLLLNYDYFVVLPESDRSLSAYLSI